mgnify:CR=1 FL=1
MQVKLETAFRLAVIRYFEDYPAKKMYLFSLRPEAITYICCIYYRYGFEGIRQVRTLRAAPVTYFNCFSGLGTSRGVKCLSGMCQFIVTSMEFTPGSDDFMSFPYLLASLSVVNFPIFTLYHVPFPGIFTSSVYAG